MPAITRIKTAKVPFALATPKGPLVVTDRRVPPPAVAEIALRLPAPPKVRGMLVSLPVRQHLAQGPKNHNCRPNGDETNV
jgi:hypothetical protein